MLPGVTREDLRGCVHRRNSDVDSCLGRERQAGQRESNRQRETERERERDRQTDRDITTIEVRSIRVRERER